MSHTGLWVVGLIVIFILGSLLGLRVSPREKALGEMRTRARQMGLHPRLVAAPDWIDHRRPNGERGGMVAFYHVILPQAQLPLVQARVENQHLTVIRGAQHYKGRPFEVRGALAVEMQANSIGVYWDEDQDLHGAALDALKAQLLALAQG